MKVLSWNILADGLTQDFTQVEQKSLEWNVRGPAIVKIIKQHNPDVICLAECNRFDYLLQRFPDYLGVFQSKGKTAKSAQLGGPACGDGVAILWRKSLGLCDMRIQVPKVKNYAVQVVIHVQSYWISMTHFKAKAPYAAKRVAQCEAMLSVVEPKVQRKERVILCGDFNATPDEPCIQELTRKYTSVCAGLPWTTWKTRAKSSYDKRGTVKHTIDYIFSNCPSQGIPVPVPTHHPDGLVASGFPSDHLPLVAVFP